MTDWRLKRLLEVIKKKNKKTGGALAYVIITIATIFFIFLQSVKSREMEEEYFLNYSSYLIKEDETHIVKEYLMSDFNKYMKENLSDIKEKTIEGFFLQKLREGEFREDYNTIYYDSSQSTFKIKFHKIAYSFYPVIIDERIFYEFK